MSASHSIHVSKCSTCIQKTPSLGGGQKLRKIVQLSRAVLATAGEVWRETMRNEARDGRFGMAV